jgi:hypothetical protein
MKPTIEQCCKLAREHGGLSDDPNDTVPCFTKKELHEYSLALLDQFGAKAEAQAAFHLDEKAAEWLREFIGDGEAQAITLDVGFVKDDDGAIKHGLRVVASEYPEEGAVLLVELAAPVAESLTAEQEDARALEILRYLDKHIGTVLSEHQFNIPGGGSLAAHNVRLGVIEMHKLFAEITAATAKESQTAAQGSAPHLMSSTDALQEVYDRVMEIAPQPDRVADDDVTACNVCGRPVLYGERHPKCGQTVLALEAERDQLSKDADGLADALREVLTRAAAGSAMEQIAHTALAERNPRGAE